MFDYNNHERYLADFDFPAIFKTFINNVNPLIHTSSDVLKLDFAGEYHSLRH